jgi:biotin transport system substrate-specific component
MLAGVAVIYVCGVVQLAVYLGGHIGQALLMGALPFVPVDAAKALLAAGIGTALLPKSEADQPDAD